MIKYVLECVMCPRSTCHDMLKTPADYHGCEGKKNHDFDDMLLDSVNIPRVAKTCAILL
jgi:hypothetical protein